MTQDIEITKLKPNPNNPRVIKDAKFKKLVQSIIDFPQMLRARPIVVNPDFVVLGGNMRLRALKEAGIKTTPVYVADWEEAKNREFIIKDNIGYGEWDWELLANDWEISELENWGLDWDYPEKKKAAEDSIPDNVPAVTVYGDLYELNNHRLLCGDSCNTDDVDKLMQGQKADLIFTDPPYDLEDNYTSLILGTMKKNYHCFIVDGDKQNVKRAYENDTFRKFFTLDFRIARLISNSQPMQRTTLISEFVNGKGRFKNIKDGFSTLVESAVDHKDFEKTGFNQAKKVELPETFILHYSDPNDIVVDFFVAQDQL